MRRPRGRNITQVYRKFEDTDRYLIEVGLDKYEDIFNEWDPVPFKRRDLDPDLHDFLEECSEEISLRHPIAIAFYLPKARVDAEKQEKCIEGLRNFFMFNHYLAGRQLTHTYKNIGKYVAIGITFLAVAVFFDSEFEKTVLSGILGQGLFIGGWVFIWEALSVFAFKNAPLKKRYAEWARFMDSPIVFKKEKRPDQVYE